jgi:hypothetical protein
VLGDDDEFVTHPDARFQAPMTIHDKDIGAVPAQLLGLIKKRETGFVEGVDFRLGKPARFCVCPVPAADWTVVIVLPKG